MLNPTLKLFVLNEFRSNVLEIKLMVCLFSAYHSQVNLLLYEQWNEGFISIEIKIQVGIVQEPIDQLQIHFKQLTKKIKFLILSLLSLYPNHCPDIVFKPVQVFKKIPITRTL